MGDPADEAALARYAESLAAAFEAVVERWVVESVLERAVAAGVAVDDDVRARVEQAARRTRDEVVPAMRELLATDIDEQRSTPLALVRSATRASSELLDALGVAPAERDEFSRRSFPEDRHGLAPANMGEVDESLREPALVWGAAKAHVHLQRRRAEGRR